MANLKNLIVTGSTRLIGKVYAPGGIEGTASNASKVNNHTVDKDVPSNAVFTDTTSLSSMTGTLGVNHGGTGKTTGQEAANYFINELSTGSSDPTDNDYYIAQYAGGGTTTTSYHRRPVSALWNYIKGKISSVLGLTATNYGGKAATAGTADSATSATKATNDGSNNNIVNTYATKTALKGVSDLVGDTAVSTQINNAKLKHSPSTTTKAYVTGTSTATENTGNQTFDTGVYLSTTAGRLETGSVTVGATNSAVGKCAMTYNATDECVSFVFG